jgi:hypothetical protein
VSDDESEEEPDDGEEMEVDAGADTQDQAVKKLVRYALACEFQRLVIRRTGIAEKGWSPMLRMSSCTKDFSIGKCISRIIQTHIRRGTEAITKQIWNGNGRAARKRKGAAER